MPKTICVDFDGVIHSYTSGWEGAAIVSDPPVPGAMGWLVAAARAGLELHVYSSRSRDPEGVDAMQEAIQRWLVSDLGMNEAEAFDFVETQLRFPTQKPAAYLTIDDRCICFTGTFPSLAEIEGFKSWVSK